MSRLTALSPAGSLLVALLLVQAPGTARAEEAIRVDVRLASLERWLAQDDPILRAMAAFELRRHDDPGAVHLAVRLLQQEQDPVAVGCALGSLTTRSRPDLVAEGGPVLAGLLVRLVAHENRTLRERAGAVLRTLAGKDPAEDSRDLRLWWLRARDALAKEQAALLEARRRPAQAHAGGTPPAPDESVTVPADRTSDLYDYVAELRRDGLEVCIVMDSTGSMGQVIGRARSRAAAMMKRLAWLVPRFRAGLVTYDDAARLRIALTSDGDALQEAFRRLVASGGGDWEEGVDKGIALALRQETMAWSAKAWRVLIVIGDAPPHLGDVPSLMRRITRARADDLYVHSVIVSTVSTRESGVDHFEAIAAAGGGIHVTLGDTRRLQAELVALSFGAGFRDRVQPWLDEVDLLRK